MKFLKKCAVVLLGVVLLVSMAACAHKLSGTYKSKGPISQSITFDGDKVTTGLLGFDIDGTYVIENGTIVITYEVLGVSTNWEKSFEEKGNSIFIDGTEYIKE